MHRASMVYFLSVCGGMYPIVKKVNFTIAPSANPRISFPEVLTINTGDSRYLSISAFASSDHNPIKVKTSPSKSVILFPAGFLSYLLSLTGRLAYLFTP